MKLLIPCSSSTSPEAIVRDLEYAGLPSQSHALLLVPVGRQSLVPIRIPVLAHAQHGSHYAYSLSDHDHLLEIDDESERVRRILLEHFPHWFVEFEVDDRSPSSSVELSIESLSEVARTWQADLIILGSEGRDHSPHSLERISRLAIEAPCSVRIVHPRYQHPDAPLQILAYIDGSEESVHMVEGFSARSFPRNARLHLFSVVAKREKEIGIFHQMLDYFAEHLRQEFPHIESQIRYGDAVEQILHYADQQEIDSIFIPAHGLGERAHLRAAIEVAQRAETTVEIVRNTRTTRTTNTEGT